MQAERGDCGCRLERESCQLGRALMSEVCFYYHAIMSAGFVRCSQSVRDRLYEQYQQAVKRYLVHGGEVS